MSWQMAGAVKPLRAGASGKDLLVSEKMTLLLLAEYYNEDRKCAWVSVSRLAYEALCSERTLYRVLDSLESTHGLIRIEKDGDGRNIYRINLRVATDIVSSPKSTNGDTVPDTGVTPETEIVPPVAQNEGRILIEENESAVRKEEKQAQPSQVTEPDPQNQTPDSCRACGEVGRHTCRGYHGQQKSRKSKIRPIRAASPRDSSDFSTSAERPKQEVSADHGFNVNKMRLYRELRKLYKENTGKSFGDLGRESADKWLEACTRHGPELIEKAFWLWLEAKGKGSYVKRSDRPGVIFVYDIEGFVIDATTEFKPKESSSDPNAALLLSAKGKSVYERHR